MVNQVVIVGRITRDIELRSTATGREVVNFTVAVNRNFKNAQGEYDADFIGCIAFGQTAKFMNSYIGKGRLVSVVGRIQTRNYENNQGQRVYVTEVIADNVNALDRRQDDGSNFNGQTNNYNSNSANQQSPQDFMDNQPISQPSYALNDIDDDDLPF